MCETQAKEAGGHCVKTRYLHIYRTNQTSLFLLCFLLTRRAVRILQTLFPTLLLAFSLKPLAHHYRTCFSRLTEGACFPTERLWLPSGPADGGHHAGRLFHHGTALVCGCDCPVHHTCEQPQAGVCVLCPWGAAQVPGHPRAESYGPYDLRADGLLGLHDSCPKGNQSARNPAGDALAPVYTYADPCPRRVPPCE